MDNIQKQLFNIQRFQILKTKLDPQTAHLISNAYAYSWHAKICPIGDMYSFHVGFEDCFEIKKGDVTKIISVFDENFSNGVVTSFEEQRKDKRLNSIGSLEIAAVLRCYWLQDSYDLNFWQKLLETAHNERTIIVKNRNALKSGGHEKELRIDFT